MSEKEGDLARAVVQYIGRVQGVGFRFTTVRIAASFRVNGYVRNEPDGSVTVIAEGERSEVKRFIDAVSTSPMSRYIRNTYVCWEPPQGETGGFTIG